MKRPALIFWLFLLAGYVSGQEWRADWEQLEERPYPQWFDEAKLGIFIHWGLYSVPAYSCTECYGEWFLRGLQLEDTMRVNFMKKNYGENFTYRDFAPLFKAELFDPDEWAELFKKAGAGYVILVSKHHDGFALWPSKYSPGWNSVEIGPKRDIVGELSASIRNSGIKMGLYYSLPEWNNPLYRWGNDPKEKVHKYVEEYMIPQFKELIGTYKPSLIFSDGDWDHPASTWHSAELISWYYNLMGKEAIVNNRWGGGSTVGFLTPEYSAGINVTDRPWAECRGLGRSFGLNRYEKIDAYMSPEELIHFFVKAVANGGGVTLNVGPKADGQIPLLQQERLLQLGEWLEVNGEAIYGSKPWERTGEYRELSVNRIDNNIDFNWVRNTPLQPVSEDHFTGEWTGILETDQKGTYYFQLEADDEAELWIDDKLILQSGKKDSLGLKLKKNGSVNLRVNYRENTQNARIRLSWTRPDGIMEVIPAAKFKTLEGRIGLEGTYRSKYQYLAYTRNHGNLYMICLEWPGDKLEVEYGEEPPVSVKLLGLDKELPFRIEGGKLILDTSGIGINDLPSDHAWTFRISN